jgi:hypothetical protein
LFYCFYGCVFIKDVAWSYTRQTNLLCPAWIWHAYHGIWLRIFSVVTFNNILNLNSMRDIAALLSGWFRCVVFPHFSSKNYLVCPCLFLSF